MCTLYYSVYTVGSHTQEIILDLWPQSTYSYTSACAVIQEVGVMSCLKACILLLLVWLKWNAADAQTAAPQIVLISSDTTVAATEPAIMVCVTQQQANGLITWTHNGQTITNSSLVTITEEDVVVGESAFTQSFLQICSAATADAGVYTCTASNGTSSVNSSTQLTVNAVAETAELVIISSDSSLPEGETALLTCVGYGVPSVEITWMLNGDPVSNSSLISISEEDVVEGDRLFRQSFLQICNVGMANAGVYTCVVSNGETSVNSSTLLIVAEAETAEVVIISNHRPLTVGETALLACVGYGVPSVEITWILNGETISNSSMVYITEEDVVEEGRLFKQSFLQICSVRMSDAGVYTCVVRNGANSANSTTQLTVTGGEAVELVILSDHTFLPEGETALLACVGYGVPSVEVTWLFNDQAISNSSLVSEDVIEGDRLFRQSILQICSFEMSDAGLYTCVVSNGANSVNFTTQLTVTNPEAAQLVIISNHKSLPEGETALLACVGYGVPSVEISWMLNGETISNTSLISITEEDVVEGDRLFRQSVLQICSVQMADAGVYNCVVRNGPYSVNSTTQLTVTRTEAVVELVIISNHMSVPEGETALLACIGYGVPSVEITWIHNNQTISNTTTMVSITEEDVVAGDRLFRQSLLQICSFQLVNLGVYTCIVSNGANSVNSTTRLTVAGAEAVELVIISNDTSLPEGEIALLACVGYGFPRVEVTWMRNGQAILNSSEVSITEDDVIEGQRLFRQSVLQICSVEMANAGIYTCVFSNGEISVNSSAQLAVTNGEAIELVIISNHTSLPEGETAFLACVCYGLPTVEITWMLNGQAISNSSEVSITEEDVVEGDRLFRQSVLQICSVEVANAGVYTCVVSNGVVSVNSSSQLTVTVAELVIISNDTSLPEGETALLACIGYGFPRVEVTWMRNGQTISNSSLVTITEEDVVEGERLFRQSVLQICSVRMANAGAYTCVVGNGVSSVDSSTQLTVTAVEVTELVIISNQTSLAYRETGFLACVGYGLPTVEITWMRDGQTIMNSSLVTITENDVVQGRRLFRQSILQLCGVNSGSYVCVVSNGLSTENYTVNLLVALPEVTVEGVGELMISRDSGGNITLQCRAYGVPDPSVTWLRQNTLLLPSAGSSKFHIDSRTDLDSEGVVSVVSSLTIVQLSLEDTGNYTCRAFNNISSASLSMPYVLRVNPDYCSGDPCQNGGTCTSGQTTFSCDCAEGYTGPTCEMESTTLSPPELTESPQSTIVSFLDQASFSCVATGNPQPDIQWFKDGALLPDETAAMLVIEQASLSNRGFYYCTATNSEGMVTSVRAMLNIRGLYQFLVPVVITLSVSETFVLGEIPSDEVITDIYNIIDGLNAASNRLTVGIDPVYAILMMGTEGSVTTVSSTGTMGDFMTGVLVTLLDRQETPVQPSSGVLQELAALIERLASDQNQRVNVDAQNIRRFDGCSMETTQLMVASTNRGELQWDEGAVGLVSASRCPCDLVPVPRHASRVCGGNFVTRAMWMEPNTSACEFDAHAFELCDAANMDEVERLSAQTARVSALGIIIITLNIEQTSGNATGNIVVTNQLLNLIDNIQKVSLDEMKASHEEFNSSSRIRGQLDLLMENYPITETPQHIIRDTFGCSLYPDLSNTALSFSPSLGDGIELEAAPTPNLTITLPETLAQDAGVSPQPSLAFCGYKTESLFVRRDSYLVNSSRISLQLSSGVVSARPALTERITDLTENVKIRFIKSQETSQTLCSYWDQSLDGGYGGWSEENCQLVKESGEEANCECNHLTNFAILTDTSIGLESNIQFYTILGVGVAFLCVLIVLIIILISSKSRSSTLSVVIVNLCISLLCLYVSYTISHFVGSSEGACRFFSFLFHYLLLVSATALAIMAFFTAWTPSADRNSWAPCGGKLQIISYVVAIILNWVIPLVLVIICIAAGADNYSPINTAHFCRPVAEPYWFGLLMVGCLIIVVTLVFLIIAPICIKTGYVKKPNSSQSDSWFTDYLGLVSIASFFFVGWGFGLPATHPLNLGAARIVFQVIFIVCNLLQGLVMVLCYCLKVWRSYTLPGADMPHAEDNGIKDEGLLFENPLSGSSSTDDDSLPDLQCFEGGKELKKDLNAGDDDKKEELLIEF